ncbi:MAG: transcription-repair coupling factor [Flavobacteriaceae bacterium]
MIFVGMIKVGNNPHSLPFFKSLKVQKLRDSFVQNKKKSYVNGLYGSSKSFFVKELFRDNKKIFLWILNDKETAAYHFNDLENFMDKNNCYFFPSSYKKNKSFINTDSQNIYLRTEILKNLSLKSNPKIIVTYPKALSEKVLIKKEIRKRKFKISIGQKIKLEVLNEKLFEYDFNKEDFVSQPGDFSIRGGIVDVFSYSNQLPFRIEFFGDEIESIRTFELESQMSNNTFKSIDILADLENKNSIHSRESLMDFLNPDTLILIENSLYVQDELINSYKLLKEKANSNEIEKENVNNLFYNGQNFNLDLNKFLTIEFKKEINTPTLFKTIPQPAFNKKFDLLIKELIQFHENNYSIKIFCSSKSQINRFNEIFEKIESDLSPILIEKSIYKGFINHQDKEVCFSDHEIFERYHKFNIRTGFSIKKRVKLNELNQLEKGDYVTHIDHGIGIFGGLQKIVVNGKKQEAVKLSYGDRDTLYLSIHLIHKICKYSGKDGTRPKIFKLGSNAWKKIKLKAKKRVKELAFNLIEAYAKRKLKKGFQYGPDSSIQHELEASFIYEDTPDQNKSTSDIKNDMESLQPMDRLICGDVGFGKTEIAIRAAFKAIDNGKQVAVLVPTTVLAFQHFKTFSNRLNDFPVTIDYLNRFRTNKEKNIIKSELKNGTIDLIIGTHQLVNKSVDFKDLGLLIVDEEQKFGVNVKEKIRSLKENIDVLTLTATPIPRTLQYSLMSARDLSIINTPPQNRFPIESNVILFKEEIIKEAINFEIQRGGQVFFIHNRIENIQEVSELIARLVPNAEIAIVHGKVEGKKLEKTMLDFINGKFDVLISTTIVESGLDVPNANTIFINNSQNFGLSDLHQMRGRVGRSNKKAFCYFICAPFSSITKEARKRIEAIERHTELGSGFYIAMKDLEIRGAGDLLGAEQSGFINDIGFETYQKILKEAVDDLKSKEFKDLFDKDIDAKNIINNFQIDTDLEILFPDSYITNIKERLISYKKLSEIKTVNELKEFKENLKDRFGKIPQESIDLLKTVELKWVAVSVGFEKIILKNNKLICQFISDKEHNYYSSGNFQKTLKTILQNKKICEVKEKKNKDGEILIVVFKGVNSVDQAIKNLKGF